MADFEPLPLIGFKSQKAAQVAAFFADKSGRSIEKMKLIKLMYLSEREHLRLHGRPMLYDELFSLQHGPICSSSLNAINGNIDKAVWNAFIARNGHKNVAAKREINRDLLQDVSDAELEILEDIWKQFGHMTSPEIRAYTHKHCPEYVEVERGRVPISYKELLSAVGRDDAEEVSDTIAAYRRVQGLLAM